MQKLLIVVLLILHAYSLKAAMGVEDDLAPTDLIPFDMSFCSSFFPEDIVREFIADLSYPIPLLRMPGFSSEGMKELSEKEKKELYLNKICNSLTLSMPPKRCIELTPDACKEHQDQKNMLKLIYEYLYKLNYYGFSQLIPATIQEISSAYILPSSDWLIEKLEDS